MFSFLLDFYLIRLFPCVISLYTLYFVACRPQDISARQWGCKMRVKNKEI